MGVSAADSSEFLTDYKLKPNYFKLSAVLSPTFIADFRQLNLLLTEWFWKTF